MELLYARIESYKPNQDHGRNVRLFNFAINSARPLDLFKIHGGCWLENAERTLLMLLRIGENFYGYGGEDNFLLNTIAIGNLHMTKVLLAHGATEYIEKRDPEYGNSTALQVSVELGQQPIFMELLKHRASVQTEFYRAQLRLPGTQVFPDQREDRSSFLHFCAEIGSDVFFVREFISRGLPVSQPDADWRTPLYLALKSGYFEIASELLNNGATLNEVRDGQTILGQLAEEGFSIPKERFLWLLKQQPKPQATLLLASQRHRQSIFHLLAQDSRMVRHPLWAKELIAFFIEQVSDMRLLNLQDVHLDTALHIGVRCLNIEIVRALLDAGADVNLTNADRKTPLNIARGIHDAKGQDISRILEVYGGRRWVELRQEESEMDSILSLWKDLGFEEQLVEWLDTALVTILQELRETLLNLFRSDGFLVQENPWRMVNQATWDFLSVNQAILANEARIKQFEYAVEELL
jgi:hypothetical protein